MASINEINISTGLSQPTFYGASQSYRFEHLQLLEGDIDTLAVREYSYLLRRSKNLIRNNPLAAKAFNKSTASLGNIKVIWKTPDGKKHEEMSLFWDYFIKSPSFDGFGDFYTYQALINMSIFGTGNAFTQFLITPQKKKVLTPEDEYYIPLKLKLIPSHYWDLYASGKPGSNELIRNGIKFDPNGIRTHYGFNESRYNTLFNKLGSLQDETKWIPVEELVHSFYRTEPNQYIGIPALTSAIALLYSMEDLEDAVFEKQKAAQAISWIIEQSNELSNIRPAIGETEVQNEGTEQEKIVFKATGGNVQYLAKGQKPHFYQSTDLGPNLGIFVQTQIRKIASAVELAYHELANDPTQLSFSAIRAINIAMKERIKYIHNVYTIPCAINPIAEKFKSIAVLYNPSLDDAIPTYRLPRFYGADGLKDAQEDLLEIKTGITAFDRVLEERDENIDEILEGLDLIAGNELLKNSIFGGSGNSKIDTVEPTVSSRGS